MKTHRIIGAVVIAALAATTIAGCSTQAGTPAGTTGSLKTVNVGTVPLALFAPLYVADAKGYFADKGIKLNIQTVTSGQDAIPLVSNGQMDVLIAGFSAGMFNAVKAGLDVKVVGSMNVGDADPANPAAALVVATALKDKVTSIADLKGRKVALAGGVGGAGAYYLGEVLKTTGLTLNDITIVNLANPNMPTALSSGSVDAAFTSTPFNSTAITSGAAFQLARTPDGSAGTGVIYGGKFAKTGLAQPFFDALAHGSKDLQGSGIKDAKNLKIIADATKQDPQVVASSPQFRWLPNLAPHTKALTDMESIWKGAGALNYTDPLDQSKFVDSTFSNNVK